MRKKIIINLAALMLLLLHTLGAQNDLLKLRGSVLTQGENTPIELVNIIAFLPDSTFVDGVVSDKNGNFSLNLKPGSYKLDFSFIGFINKSIALDLSKSQELDVHLEPSSVMLETVSVEADRSSVEQLIDKKVLHVGKDLQSTGGDALSLFEQLPEVTVESEGNISFRGSRNINILINGKPSPLSNAEVLQQISSAEIQKIEFISSPSAKYRADGLSGIINIITKRDAKQGFNAISNVTATTNPRYAGGTQMSYGTEKFNLNLGAQFSDNKNRTKKSRHRTSETFAYTQDGKTSFDGHVFDFKSGLDWFPNPKNELSFSFRYNESVHDILQEAVVEEFDAQNETRTYDFSALNNHQHKSWDYNANYRKTLGKKNHYLELDYHLSNNDNLLTGDFQDNLQQWTNIIQYSNQISNIAADYVLPIEKSKMKLETGLLWINKDIDNRRTGSSDASFLYEENVLGLYSLLEKNWDKFSAKLGLRYEWYEFDAVFENTENTFQNKLNNFFPSLHLLYKFSDLVQVNLGYNRRIARPNLWHINPFTNPNDRYFIRVGNQELNPEFSDNIEASFSSGFEYFSVSATFLFRNRNDIIVEGYDLNQNNETILTFLNTGKAHTLGTELGFSFFFLDPLKTNINANLYWGSFTNDATIFNGFGKSQSSSLNVKNQFKINKKISLDLTWIYRGLNIYQFQKYQPRQKFDLAMSAKILKDKGSLSLRLTDIFNTYRGRSFYLGEGFEENTWSKGQTRALFTTFTYRFSKGEISKKRNKKRRNVSENGARE